MANTYLAVSLIVDNDTNIESKAWTGGGDRRYVTSRVGSLTLIFNEKEDLDRLIESLSMLSDQLMQGLE